MKVETKTQMEQRLKNEARQRNIQRKNGNTNPTL